MNAPAPVPAEQLPVVVEPTSIMQVIERASKDPATDVDKLERLLGVYERITARQAETAFNQAMQAVQQELPRILRDAKNDTTSSRYVRLESLNKQLVPIYTRHGFSLSFGNGDAPGPDTVRVTCTVSHAAGHSRAYQVDVPLDLTGMKGTQNKTRTHAFGSSNSYGRRYLTLLIFNVALVNEDDDGNAAGTEYVSEQQAADLLALATEVGADVPRLLKYIGADDFAHIPEARFKDALAALKRKGGAK